MEAPAAAGDPGVDGDAERVAANLARRLPAREVVLTEHRLDAAEMGVLGLVAEPHVLAVREEDERHVELIGIAPSLRFARAQIDACALGFQHGERTALAVEQRVVRPAAVIEWILEPHAAAIGERPIRILQKLVYLYARERLIGHVSPPPWSPFRPCPRAPIARKAVDILPPKQPPRRRAHAFRSAPALHARCRS